MSPKEVIPLFLIIISLPLIVCIFRRKEPCCEMEDCAKFCGKEKYGICTGNPNCQTVVTGVNPDKTTGQGRCKCKEKGPCCNDQDCSCEKGLHPVCTNGHCKSEATITGGADILGQGTCDCVRNGCCIVSECHKKCAKGNVLRCVGTYQANICSTGRCVCENTCAKLTYNQINDCEKIFGYKCASKDKKAGKPIVICEEGKCSCSDQAQCTVDEECKGFTSFTDYNNTSQSLPNYEKLICSPKQMKAYCSNGLCGCKEIDKCTADLCQVALKYELNCCQKHKIPDRVTICAEDVNKRYDQCLKELNCERNKKGQWSLPGGIPCVA